MYSSRALAWLFTLATLLTTFNLIAARPYQRNIATGITPSLTGSLVTMGSGTYPRANYLQDGSILGVFTAFANGLTSLTTVRSIDGGASWTQIGVITSVTTADHDADNPYVLQLPSGRVLAAFRNHDRDASGYTFFRITVCYSDDNGATWAYLSQPASDPGPINGNWEPLLRNAADGTLQIFYSRENSASDQDSLMRTSTDGGQTWSTAIVISGADQANTRDGMLGVAVTSGSNLIAVFETETNGGQFHIGSVTSSDDGSTWGNRQVVYQPSIGNANAPQVVNVGGTMVVSFQTNEDDSNNANGMTVKVVTSGDGGNSWGNKLTVIPETALWAGALAMNDNTHALIMADHEGAKAQAIALS